MTDIGRRSFLGVFAGFVAAPTVQASPMPVHGDKLVTAAWREMLDSGAFASFPLMEIRWSSPPNPELWSVGTPDG